jgi:hypothetical protein
MGGMDFGNMRFPGNIQVVPMFVDCAKKKFVPSVGVEGIHRMHLAGVLSARRESYEKRSSRQGYTFSWGEYRKRH